MADIKQKERILDIIFNRLGKDDCIVFLFGSYAAGEEIKNSDIDIGILCSKKPGLLAEVEEELNSITLRKIDLVDFSSVSKKVKEEALKEIKIWHIGKNCRGLLKNLKPDSIS
ncbi:MAG: nucleotidyltransferase domain-containing protein [Deltaproteobacteria bacterium]|nr:nucleotidyltransferase domain-containing protein [Deltaproteobacteria bacterium]